ncbi:hypothetical protein HKI87_02g15870 [Chloropicon roscoffensis]|uniref:Uncharacterized protein n=1 Tax=Chloropicon roscoffensis TaxID=1461544 RepID=A0AAX4P1M6_9CHLO
MIHGNGVGDGESLPATTVPETARTVPCHLNPAQVGQLSVNGKVGEAEAAHAEAEAAHAEAVARIRVAQAKLKAEEWKARAAHIEAAKANELANEAVKRSRAETLAKSAEADARFRAERTVEAESIAVARARRAAMVKMATVEALEADLKIVKLRKELEVLTGVPLDGRDEEQNSGTVLLEDSEVNKQKHSSPRSPRFSEDGLKRKRIEPSTPDCSSR